MEKYDIIFRNMEQINQFVALAEKNACDMDLGEGSSVVDAKSLMSVLIIGLNKRITLTVHGDVDETFKTYISQLL